MKSIKKYENGGGLTPEQRKDVEYRIKELRGEIGVVNRAYGYSDERRQKEVNYLNEQIKELEAKLK